MAGKRDSVKDSDRYSVVVPNLTKCMICGTSDRVCIHEVFYGTSARKKSKEDGMCVPLCFEHHQGMTGVHFNKNLDTKLKQQAQRVWMREYGEGSEEERMDQFIMRYGKNYILDED